MEAENVVKAMLSYTAPTYRGVEQILTFPPGQMPAFPQTTATFLQDLRQQELHSFLTELHDGTMILCRGRDSLSDSWDYGMRLTRVASIMCWLS